MNKQQINSLIASTLLGLVVQGTHAAAPESGSALQGSTPPAAPSAAGRDVLPPVSGARAPGRPAAGGPTVELRTIVFEGNERIDSAVLLTALGDATARKYDLSGLWGLADTVERIYRTSGYPFAQAWIGPQDLKAGTLRISVLEGRYGKVVAMQSDKLPEGAQDFLDYALKTGDPIEAKLLERTMLLLDDQPGVRVQPHLHPGAANGEGNLTVAVDRSSNVSGEVGADNIGSVSTGRYRARGAVNINSPFIFGDRVSFSGMYTDERMFLGSAEYERPLGPSGLRGGVGYAHTSYVLGGAYANLDAKGIADITSARLSYPLVRSQATNVWLSMAYLHKNLEDRYNAAGVVRNKTSDSVPLGVQFDHRDALVGGGVTYGYLTWTNGRLNLDSATAVTDAKTAKTEGSWSKLTLDIARIQNLPDAWRLYGRISSQWSNKNLDSSEKLGVSGFYGVRAYPMGESMSDGGVVAQVELRYVLGSLTPFVFYDQAHARLINTRWDSSVNASRTLSASGLGARYLDEDWTIDATLAWRGTGGPALSEADRNPRLFVMATRRF